jgi:hypothetical protein
LELTSWPENAHPSLGSCRAIAKESERE